MKGKRVLAVTLITVVAAMVLLGLPVVAKTEVFFASTQFRPIEEQQFIRDEILQPFTDETSVNVVMIAEDYGQFIDRLLAEAKAQKVNTDVIGTLHGDFPDLLANDIPQDLDRINELPGRTFIPELVKLGQMDGRQVYVPWTQATYLMVANKKALAYLPAGADINALTYEQLLQWAKNMNDETGGPKVGFPAGPKGLFGRMLHGYLYPSFTGHQVQKFDSPEGIQVWEYLKDIFQYSHPSSVIYESMSDPLLLEEVWVTWDHTARLSPALREKPDLFVAFPSPAGPKGRAFISVIAGLGIPKGAKNLEDSWKLIDLFTQPEIQVKILKGTGFFPTTYEAGNYVPEGALKILADAVTKQASSKDAVVSLLPVGLGNRTGEFVQIYKDTFQAVVVQGRPVEAIVKQQGSLLERLFAETKAPYPQP